MRRKIILASRSPRRKELLERIGVPFTAIPADYEQPVDRSLPLEKAIEKVAWAKAQNVAQKYPDALVIGSDTIVTIDGQVLGKPKDRNEAKCMLELLSGRTHHVITGLAIISPEDHFLTHETVEVDFDRLSADEIEAYTATDEPYDKAGAYALQGYSCAFIKGIRGDVYSVIGLPVHTVYVYLREHYD